MGSSSNKDIHIHVNIGQVGQVGQIPSGYDSTGISQQLGSSNNLNQFENMDSPAAMPINANKINAYDNNPNSGLTISINQDGKRIYANNNLSPNINVNEIISNINNTNNNYYKNKISPGQNIDNNISKSTNKNEEINKDPNIGQYVNKPQKKETTKTFDSNDDIDMNIGKGIRKKEEHTKGETTNQNPDNNIGQYNGTFTGDNDYSLFPKNNNNIYNDNKSKNNNTSTAGNIDNNIDNNIGKNIDNNKISNNSNYSNDFNYRNMVNTLKNKNASNSEQNYEEGDLELSQSVISHSFGDLKFNDPQDRAKIKEIVSQKYNEGYYSLFIKMDNMKNYFYFIKMEHNLNHLLNAHLKSFGKSPTGENYSFYKNSEKLDPNIPIQDLDVPILSVITVK